MNEISEVDKLTLRILVGILHYLITPEVKDNEAILSELKTLINEIIDFAKEYPNENSL